MNHDRLTQRTVGMVDDAVTRSLSFGEVVDVIEVAMVVLPTPQGMSIGALIYVALKGPVIGTTLGNIDLVTDLGLLSSQKFVDDRVRACLEAIRAQRAEIVASANGSMPISQ